MTQRDSEASLLFWATIFLLLMAIAFMIWAILS
jgi:hypothetical protein